MKAIRLHEPSGVEGLRYEEVAEPTPSIGDVLVRVHAAGITPTELLWPLWTDRNGHKRDHITPAHEFSGVVTAVGFGAPGFAVGDEVYGLIDGLRDGAAAEYIAVEAHGVARKPKSVDFVHAAALPQSGLTSWQALFDFGDLKAGETVLVHGAAGALGNMAIQLARIVNARVIGTGRRTAKPLVLESGADEFVDLERGRWEDDAGQVDLVYDTIGGEILERSLAVVKPGGALVTAMMPPRGTRDDIRIVHFVRDPNRAQLTEIARLVNEGKIVPHVGAVYPLADAKAAFTAKESGGVRGKVILQP